MRLKKNQFEENFSLVFTVGIGDVYISLNLKKKKQLHIHVFQHYYNDSHF
jgi:hypothetical protein